MDVPCSSRRDATGPADQGANFTTAWGGGGPTNITVIQHNATSLELLVDGATRGAATG
jgi:hypothetical protein